MASRWSLDFRTATSPFGLSVGLALSGLASPAAAQYGGAPTQLPPISVEGGSTGGGDYQPTQPTLPKLTQPLIDTPQTIEAVPRQLMDDQGVTNMRDALRNVPGISIAAGEAASQGDSLTIRGFTARGDIYLDGMRDFGSYYRDPFFLDDIEVLKGPSSILFGRGSTGGVIEQDSKVPTLSPFIAGTASFGSDFTKRLTADIDEPLPSLGQGAAFRVNVMAHDSEVSRRDDAENSRFGIAPSLALGLGTPTRLTLTYLHQTEYDTPDYGVPWLYQGVAGQGTGLARPANISQNNYYGFENGNYLRTNVDIPTAKFEHDFSENLSFRDQLRYAHYTREFSITEPQLYIPGTNTPLLVAPGTPLSALSVTRNQLYGTSLETYLVNQSDLTAKFKTGFIAHTLVAGLELGRETSDPIRYTTLFSPTLSTTTSLVMPTPGQADNASTYLSSITKTTAETQAIYALDTLQLTDQWQVMGGLRLDRFDASFQQTTLANPLTGAGAANVGLGHVDKTASWRGAILYKPAPNGSIYFDAGTSFDPSAEQLSLSAANANLSPTKNTSFELGTKWNLFHESLLVTGAVYETQQTNVRETDPNNPLFQILVGDAVAKGIELGAVGRITERWQVLAGYAYTYSVIDSSPQNDLGHRLANVPMHTGNVWTTYRLPSEITIGGGIDIVASRFAATTPTTAGGVNFWKEVPGYWTLNAMARYPLNQHVDLQLNFYNLTNNQYYDQVHPAHVIPGAGTSALFTASFKY
jgi:catecholate siderophore receptor